MRKVVSGKAGGIARKPATGRVTGKARAKTPITMRSKGKAAATAPVGKYGKRAESQGFAKGMAKKLANKPVAGARGKSALAKGRRTTTAPTMAKAPATTTKRNIPIYQAYSGRRGR
jgi:hypothetical protein